MSTLKAEVVKIKEIVPHDNADLLEIVKVFGWFVVVRKGMYKVGDMAIYMPIDSVLPDILEAKLFPPDSKIKLHNSRIRSIKIRGVVSQGMLCPLEFIPTALRSEGEDVTQILGITKFEPPEPGEVGIGSPCRSRKNLKKQNSAFIKYTDIENFKKYNTEFAEGELVQVTEKLHGTSSRYGWFKKQNMSLFQRTWCKFKEKFFGMDDRWEWEFLVGSRNLQISDDPEDNVYAKIALQLDLKDKIPLGYSIYGEIVGSKIQKNYTYGCKEGEHEFYAYDVRINERGYLDYPLFASFCDTLGIKRVPLLYKGPFNAEHIKEMTKGDSTIGGQKVREGVVIKPFWEDISPRIGRKVLKLVSDDYLLSKGNSDFH
jgi:RNA ligase (TIGR02306 family)